MTRTVKWILGIVIGLVLVCAIVAVGFIAINRLNIGTLAVGRRAFLPFQGRRIMPMQPGEGMPYHRVGGFFPFGFLGGWLIFAAFLGLFALLVIALVLLLRRPSHAVVQSSVANQPLTPMQSAVIDQATTGGPAMPDQPPVADAAPTPSSAGQNCPSCGRAVQTDWNHCPYCGTTLAGSA
jgi:hypothetical protein